MPLKNNYSICFAKTLYHTLFLLSTYFFDCHKNKKMRSRSYARKTHSSNCCETSDRARFKTSMQVKSMRFYRGKRQTHFVILLYLGKQYPLVTYFAHSLYHILFLLSTCFLIAIKTKNAQPKLRTKNDASILSQNSS